MTYDAYRYIFFVTIILAPVFLVLSVVLFFVLKIPAAIGILSGRTERKAVEEIRNKIRSGVSPVPNDGQKKGSKRKGGSGRKNKTTFEMVAANETSLTSKMKTGELTHEAQESYQTSLLEQQTTENGTTVLKENATPQTTVLVPESSTVNVAAAGFQPNRVSAVWDNSFVIEYEIKYIHTDEMIP